MATSQIPFRMGDVVTFTGTYKHWQGEHIIHKVEFDVIKPLRFRYSTTQGAWIKHSELELLRPASEESLRELAKVLIEEGLIDVLPAEDDDSDVEDDDETEEAPDDESW